MADRDGVQMTTSLKVTLVNLGLPIDDQLGTTGVSIIVGDLMALVSHFSWATERREISHTYTDLRLKGSSKGTGGIHPSSNLGSVYPF